MARRLRIGIDAHAVGTRATGNERFILNAARSMAAQTSDEIVMYFSDARTAASWREAGGEARVLRPRSALVRIPVGLPWATRRDRVDVLLVQYTGPPCIGCPVVSVVHDVSFAVYPEYFRLIERLWMRRTIPWTIRRARRVVTPSQFSQSEICRRYQIPEDRVTVANLGVDPAFTQPAMTPCPVDGPFFLAVGNLQPRKNLITLIRAFDLMRGRHPEVRERLVIAGQDLYRGEDLSRALAGLRHAQDVVLLGYVEDEQLVALVQAATALAYPSLYEGFGLPVVEAMAAGTPTVVGDIPVMREIAADASIRVDVLDVEAWATALSQMALDGSRRHALADAGRRRASRFTWSACATSLQTALEAAAYQGARLR